MTRPLQRTYSEKGHSRCRKILGTSLQSLILQVDRKNESQIVDIRILWKTYHDVVENLVRNNWLAMLFAMMNSLGREADQRASDCPGFAFAYAVPQVRPGRCEPAKMRRVRPVSEIGVSSCHCPSICQGERPDAEASRPWRFGFIFWKFSSS